MMHDCPCGTGKAWSDCCGPYLLRQKNAPNPEALMRSRYTAYSVNDLDYIERTMKSPALDHFDRDDKSREAQTICWTHLEVLNTAGNATRGFVEFRAHYCMGNKNYVLHEKSEFRFEEGEWFYVSGIQPDSMKKVGRNDVCLCGSGKKYKKCCG